MATIEETFGFTQHKHVKADKNDPEKVTSVLIHPPMDYSFLELSPEFYEELKDFVLKKALMLNMEMDVLTPLDKFALMVLKDSY